MAERNRRAAHHAAPFQSEICENRDVRPPRKRALAALAIGTRRDDRKIARQPITNHADEAADARAEQERNRGADSGGQVEGHRVSITYAPLMLRAAKTHRQTLRAFEPSIH